MWVDHSASAEGFCAASPAVFTFDVAASETGDALPCFMSLVQHDARWMHHSQDEEAYDYAAVRCACLRYDAEGVGLLTQYQLQKVRPPAGDALRAAAADNREPRTLPSSHPSNRTRPARSPPAGCPSVRFPNLVWQLR